MTEVEWLAATDPMPMLEFLALQGSNRQKRLVLTACSRLHARWFTNERVYAVLEAAERYADGLIAASTLVNYGEEVSCSRESLPKGEPGPRLCTPETYATNLIFFICMPSDSTHWMPDRIATIFSLFGLPGSDLFPELAIPLLPLIREIFGNPFRPVSAESQWLTSTVVALAEGIYQERAFDRMPILADALEEAGCDNADILNHCRGDGPHVRGCWVVDLLTGRK